MMIPLHPYLQATIKLHSSSVLLSSLPANALPSLQDLLVGRWVKRGCSWEGVSVWGRAPAWTPRQYTP